MGCGQTEVSDGKKTKQFHEMSEEEKEAAKKLMEDQDKDLVENENKEEADDYYEKYNWDELIQKLPVKKTKAEREKRLALWNQINKYGNGYISYKRLSIEMEKYLDLPNVVKNKGPMKLAFDSASNKYQKKGAKKEDGLIEWMEFRIFLVYLRQYFEYWVMFERVDRSGDHQISLEEFQKAVPQMEKWGVKITDPEATFKEIDKNNEGSVSFEEFCSYAIQKSLDVEDDDGFDDEELKKLK